MWLDVTVCKVLFDNSNPRGQHKPTITCVVK